jgi:K+-sensing histidine kinase KdpD
MGTWMHRIPLIAAVFVPIVLCAALSLVRGAVDNTNAALVLVLVVVGVAATGRRLPGVVAALVSTGAFDFFLTAPYLRFAIADRDDIETAVLLVLIGLAVTEVALWGRRQQARSSSREGYLAGVVTAARLAASGTESAAGLVELVGRQIADLLDLDACRFDPSDEPSTVDRPRLEPDGGITWRGHAVDVRREGLPVHDEIELLVRSGGAILGRYLLISTSAVRRPDIERRLVVVTLADQVGAALSMRRTGP